MIRAVVDTNVWVAGLLTQGAPAQVIDLVLRAVVIPIVSPAILIELREVLRRPELGLPQRDVGMIMTYLQLPGTHVVHVDPEIIELVCKDPDDDIFTAAALAGRAEYIVTGNTRHFPPSPWRGIHIVVPRTFLSRASLAPD